MKYKLMPHIFEGSKGKEIIIEADFIKIVQVSPFEKHFRFYRRKRLRLATLIGCYSNKQFQGFHAIDE